MIVRHDHHDHDHQFYNRRVQGSISPSSSCSSTSSGSLGSSSFPFQPNSNSQGSFQFQPNPSSEHQPQFQTGKRFGSLQPLLQPKPPLNAGQWKSTNRWVAGLSLLCSCHWRQLQKADRSMHLRAIHSLVIQVVHLAPETSSAPTSTSTSTPTSTSTSSQIKVRQRFALVTLQFIFILIFSLIWSLYKWTLDN